MLPVAIGTFCCFRCFAILAWQLGKLHSLLSDAGVELCFQGQDQGNVCHEEDRPIPRQLWQEHRVWWLRGCHVSNVCLLVGLLPDTSGQ